MNCPTCGQHVEPSRPPAPAKWKIGMKVRYVRSSDWAWNKGGLATIVGFRDDQFKGRPGSEYQVFYTRPLGDKHGCTFWTTPDDVDLVEDGR